MRANSYVLILIPGGQRHPAVIGGYRSKEEADAAGKYACISPACVRDMSIEDRSSWYTRNAGFPYACEWVSYSVIPGAAALEGPGLAAD